MQYARLDLRFSDAIAPVVFFIPSPDHDITGKEGQLIVRSDDGTELFNEVGAAAGVTVVDIVLTADLIYPDGSVVESGTTVKAYRVAPDFAGAVPGDPGDKAVKRYRYGFISDPGGEEWAIEGYWHIEPDTGPVKPYHNNGQVGVQVGSIMVAVSVSGVSGGDGGGGVTDHGALSGLGDDDHPQYHNDARGDARYYTQAQVTAAIAAHEAHEDSHADTEQRLQNKSMSLVDGNHVEAEDVVALVRSSLPGGMDIGIAITFDTINPGAETYNAHPTDYMSEFANAILIDALPDDATDGRAILTGTIRNLPIYDPAWVAGETILYADGGGLLVADRPRAPYYVQPIALVVRINGTASVDLHILVGPSLQHSDNVDYIPTAAGIFDGQDTVDKALKHIETVHSDAATLTGFIDATAQEPVYDPIARTITLFETGGAGTLRVAHTGRNLDADIYDSMLSPSHPDEAKGFFLIHDNTGLQWLDVAANPGYPLYKHVMIAFVTKWGFGIKETHSVMDPLTHANMHSKDGTFRNSLTGEIGGYVLDSITPANRRPTISEIVLNDEDNITTRAELSTNSYTIMSLSGAGEAEFSTGNADIIPLSGSTPYYNQLSGGVWGQALMSNNDYAATFVIAIPTTFDAHSQAYRFIFVQPQQVGGPVEIGALGTSSINFGDFFPAVPEGTVIAKIVKKFVGGDWSIVSVTPIFGTRQSQLSISGGTGLTSVESDDTLSGDGTTTSPLSVAAVTSVSTDNAIVRFDGVTGAVQDSAAIITDSGYIGLGAPAAIDSMLHVKGDGVSFVLKAESLSGDSLFAILSNGDIGFGTTAPFTPMHINAGKDASTLDLADQSMCLHHVSLSSVGEQRSIAFGQSTTSDTWGGQIAWECTGSFSRGTFKIMIKNTTTYGGPNLLAMEFTENGVPVFPQIPTSPTGLPAGALWSDSGVIKIV